MTASAELQLGLLLAERGMLGRERLVEQLVALARELAAKAGAEGIIVGDLRVTACQRGLLPPHGEAREMSFLGAVMRRAGLRNSGRVRRSQVPRAHANRNSVWVLP